MRWSKREAYELYCNYTANLYKRMKIFSKCEVAARKFKEQFLISDSIIELKPLAVKFVRLVNSIPTSNKQLTVAKMKDRSSTFFEFQRRSGEGFGRPRITLGDDPCKKKLRVILKDIIKSIEEFASEQNISKEDGLKLIKDECNRLWHTNVDENKHYIPEDDAVAFFYNINMSTQMYQRMRTFLLKFDTVLPTRNVLDKKKKDLHPEIKSVQLKASVDIKELLVETASALIKVAKVVVCPGQKYELTGKFGADASGSHKIRQQVVSTDASEETPHLDPNKCSSFLLSCYCPLELSCNGTIIWSNPLPNSTSYARPVSLIRSNEQRNVLRIELEQSFEIIRQPYTIQATVQEENIELFFKTECTMLDGKMVSLLQGDSGAYCHYCHASREDGNNVASIAAGFTITKSYETCRDVWERLQGGQLSYKNPERAGQCHPHILKADLFSHAGLLV